MSNDTTTALRAALASIARMSGPAGDIARETLEALAESAPAVSDYCALAGCAHKAHGCPTWPEGSTPFTTAPAPAAEREAVRTTATAVSLDALDDALSEAWRAGHEHRDFDSWAAAVRLAESAPAVAQIDPRDLAALKAGRSDVPVFSVREPIAGYVSLCECAPAVEREAVPADPTFPVLPSGVIRDAALGWLYDRVQMHTYAVQCHDRWRASPAPVAEHPAAQGDADAAFEDAARGTLFASSIGRQHAREWFSRGYAAAAQGDAGTVREVNAIAEALDYAAAYYSMSQNAMQRHGAVMAKARQQLVALTHPQGEHKEGAE